MTAGNTQALKSRQTFLIIQLMLSCHYLTACKDMLSIKAWSKPIGVGQGQHLGLVLYYAGLITAVSVLSFYLFFINTS